MTLTMAPSLDVGAGRHRPVPGATTAAANAFVEAHLEAARRLGRDLAELVHDPATLATSAATGMARLSDPAYRDAQAWVVPGSSRVAGVRGPLQRAVWGAFRRRTRGVRASTLLLVADALLREGTAELRLFALDLLGRIVVTDPEQAWQLLRRTARGAHEWVTVDTVARAYATGILAEPYRWAELEQLVYSPSRWERRLVGSTIAVLPFVDRTSGRSSSVAERGLALVRELAGDADPDVQRALAWALRSLLLVDAEAVLAWCRAETELAVRTADGHRARVLREVLPKLPGSEPAALRARLAGLRSRAEAPATSRASAIARDFALGGDPAAHPEPPLR